MKKLIVILLLLFATPAMALDPTYTGSWLDPEQPGFGINVEAHQGVTAAYFYSFDKYNNPKWWVMVGDEVLTMSVTYVVENKPLVITKEVDVGVAEIVPLAPGVIRFRYTLIAELDEGEVVLCDGEHCKGDYIFKQLTQPIK